MTVIPSRAELLATVERSPAAVGIHDRAAWVDLFAADAEVNDPVGSRPHQGRAAIERFYDTFIAPNTITFHVDEDVVCGMSVVRDLTVETVMSSGARLNIPMHLRYDLVDVAGTMHVQRLYAHWELPSMIIQLTRAGRRGIAASARLAPQLLANQGVGGAVGFMRGFARVGRSGTRAVEAFLDAAQCGDSAQELLEAGALLKFPVGTTLPIDEFGARLRGLRWGKLIAAGRYVSATVERGESRGVAFFEFGRRGSKIARVQFFFVE